MTEQILKIADDLRRLAIDEQQARTLLLGLFGVSGSLPVNCANGKHPLIIIYSNSNACSAEVVRWCPDCGAVVVDEDYDGRTNPGSIMKMKLVKQ
jgi:hypothetical protein